MKKINIRFKPGNLGLTKVLGSLEKVIMTVLWKKDEFSGRGIFEEIRRTREVAYTTILTVVSRLVKKGLIKKEKRDNIFIFSPCCTKRKFSEYVSKEVIRGLLKLSSDSTIVNFIDILSELNDKQIEEIHTLIAIKIKENSRKKKRV